MFLRSTNFGPDGFGRKYDLRRVCTLKGWIEVSVWSTLNAHFGPIDTAEMDKLLPRTFERKLCSPSHFLMIFTCLQAFLNFMSGFRPKKCFNQKTRGSVAVQISTATDREPRPRDLDRDRDRGLRGSRSKWRPRSNFRPRKWIKFRHWYTYSESYLLSTVMMPPSRACAVLNRDQLKVLKAYNAILTFASEKIYYGICFWWERKK